MQEHKLLHTPLDLHQVANFLKADPLLDKTKVGEYIGDQHHRELLRAFIESFDFSGQVSQRSSYQHGHRGEGT
jgi:hypothetical protein